MADKVICNKSDLVNIANSVRTKLGVTNPYYVSDLSGAIDSISTQSTPTLQEKTVTPSTSTQSITADNGYDGLSKVTVNGDADLIANNIKSDSNSRKLNSYLPCVAWGELAKKLESMPISTPLEIRGELHSRLYNKVISNNSDNVEMELKMAQ